ncbi:MAG TPA: hypothetical protein V6C91_11535 [Coleofasciculaceae cyanobacterium]
MKNKLLCQIKQAFTIASALLGFISYSLPVLSLPNTLASSSSNKMLIHFKVQEEDGSSRGRPARREGTGSRCNCSPVDVPLIALVPTSNIGLLLNNPYTC